MPGPSWYERKGRSRKLTMAERYYERALYEYGRGQFDEALADLDAAIEFEPKNAELYVARGLVLIGAQRIDDAYEDLDYAIKHDPTQWLVHYLRGVQAVDNDQPDQAIDSFSRAQMIAPDRPETYFFRSVAYYQKGSAKDATQDMEIARDLMEPNDPRRKKAQQWLKIFDE